MMRKYSQLKTAIMILVAGLCLGIFLPGCSDDDDISDYIPNVTLSITEMNFGEVTVDNFSVQTVTIKNLTNDNVTVERVTSTNGEIFRIGGYFSDNELIALETPITIESNGARVIYVGFYPEETTDYSGLIVVESATEGDSKIEEDTVKVKGTGIED